VPRDEGSFELRGSSSTGNELSEHRIRVARFAAPVRIPRAIRGGLCSLPRQVGERLHNPANEQRDAIRRLLFSQRRSVQKTAPSFG
jgi:hypothetical protein